VGLELTGPVLPEGELAASEPALDAASARPSWEERARRATRPAFGLFTGAAARAGYLSTADQALISLSNFIAGIYLARLIDPTQFGVYAVGFLLFHFVGAIQEGLILQPLSTLGAVMPAEAFRRYVSETALFQLLLASITAAGAWAAGTLLTLLGNDTAGPTLAGLWFLLLVWQPQEFIRRLFYPRGMILQSVWNTAVASGMRLVVLWWMGAHTGLTGVAGLNAIAWGALAAIPLGIWQTRSMWTARGLAPLLAWRKNWSFGKWVLGGMLASWGSLEVYPILAAGLISFAAAGAYRALQTVVAPVHVLMAALDPYLTPRAARVFQVGDRKALARTLRLALLVLGLPILGYLVLASALAEPALRLLYDTKYLSYVAALPLICLQYALWFLYFPLQVGLKSMRTTRPIFLAHTLAILSMFTIGIWAIERWGLYGVIGGQALNALITGAVLWFAWMRPSRQPASA
jgi:O-antigen/teichoic acid export membrane protein